MINLVLFDGNVVLLWVEDTSHYNYHLKGAQGNAWQSNKERNVGLETVGQHIYIYIYVYVYIIYTHTYMYIYIYIYPLPISPIAAVTVLHSQRAVAGVGGEGTVLAERCPEGPGARVAGTGSGPPVE